MWAEVALRKHIGIGPVAGFDIGSPSGNAVEFVVQADGEFACSRFVFKSPAVPVIVSDAPQLSVLGNFCSVFKLRRSGREAEHDWASGLANGFGDLPNFGGTVGMVADAVDLDVIEAPIGIEFQHGVVVSLACFVVLDAPVALIPRAGRSQVGRVFRMELGAGNGQVLFDDLAGYSANDVDAESESEGMDPVGERLEPCAHDGGRKALAVGNENAVLIPDVLFALDRLCERVLHVPTL